MNNSKALLLGAAACMEKLERDKLQGMGKPSPRLLESGRREIPLEEKTIPVLQRGEDGRPVIKSDGSLAFEKMNALGLGPVKLAKAREEQCAAQLEGKKIQLADLQAHRKAVGEWDSDGRSGPCPKPYEYSSKCRKSSYEECFV